MSDAIFAYGMPFLNELDTSKFEEFKTLMARYTENNCEIVETYKCTSQDNCKFFESHEDNAIACRWHHRGECKSKKAIKDAEK